jgi:hypothetical protein
MLMKCLVERHLAEYAAEKEAHLHTVSSAIFDAKRAGDVTAEDMLMWTYARLVRADQHANGHQRRHHAYPRRSASRLASSSALVIGTNGSVLPR